MLLWFGLVLISIVALNKMIPTSFLPVEDQGYFKVELELPENATLERSRVVADRAIDYLMTLDEVDYVQSVVGSSGRVGTSQSATELTVILKPWEERDDTTIEEIMNRVRKEFSRYPEAKVYLSLPPVIPGLGSSGGFEMQLEARSDATFENLVQATDSLMYYASKCKELSSLSTSLKSDIPQIFFDVDRDKAKLAGVPMAEIFSTMKAYTGSVYVNDFNLFNRVYRVYIQAEADYRQSQNNINLFYVRGANRTMIPLA
jgi:multidrug efflux pump subunit AcrB